MVARRRGAAWPPGSIVGYQLEISSTLADRMRMWRAPWDNTARGGDQIAQALWSMSAGGLFGTGLGLGDTRYLPAGHTDLVLAAVARGVGVCRSRWPSRCCTRRSSRARLRRRGGRRPTTGFFSPITIALFLAVPVLLMAGGTLGLVPLTGVVTPFLSFGGSAMVANFAALGLAGVDPIRRQHRGGSERVRRRRCAGSAVRWRSRALVLLDRRRPRAGRRAPTSSWRSRISACRRTACAASSTTRRLLDVVRADSAGKHRGPQRVAAGDRRRGSRAKGGAGICSVWASSIDSALRGCRRARCYPLGGRAFHVLGDATTRAQLERLEHLVRRARQRVEAARASTITRR